MAGTSTPLSSGAPTSVANHKVSTSLPTCEFSIFKILNISDAQVCLRYFLCPGLFFPLLPPTPSLREVQVLRLSLPPPILFPSRGEQSSIIIHLGGFHCAYYMPHVLNLRFNMVVFLALNQFALFVFCRTFCGALFFPTIATFLGSTLFEEVFLFPHTMS